jgi:hypothetical protein
VKYALRPTSRYIRSPGSREMIFIEDEKALIKFFQNQMKRDLTNPLVAPENPYSWWAKQDGDIIPEADILGVYSHFVSNELDFRFLSWSSRVAGWLRKNEILSKDVYPWRIIMRMRSLPCNYTLYTLSPHDGGHVLNRVGWGEFFRKMKKEKILADSDITFRIPEET